jgi:hypothetical protein
MSARDEWLRAAGSGGRRISGRDRLGRLIRRAKRLGRDGHGQVLQRVPLERLPGSWVVAPPDFVGIGAQKCGTSWWYEAVCAHPRVYRLPTTPKERGYFDRFSWTPPLLARAAPHARLLVLLRDPIERFRSGLAKHGNRPGDEVLVDAFARGLYHAQLTRVLEHFDRERVLILQFERCRKRPEEELRRTFAFLELEDTPSPEVLRRRVNVTTQGTKPPLEEPLLGYLRSAYRDDATRLFERFPELDPALWTTLGL